MKKWNIWTGIRAAAQSLRCAFAVPRPRVLFLSLCSSFILLGISCERRPILDVANAHYLRVYLQDSIKNVTTGFYSPNRDYPEYVRPNLLRAVLYNPQTNQRVADRFLRTVGKDSLGHFIEGVMICEPGKYKMLVYNTATEATIIRQEDRLNEIFATTNPVSINMYGRQTLENTPVYNAPDILFRRLEQTLDIPYSTKMDTINFYLPDVVRATPVTETYYIQVSIKGVQYVSDIWAEINGLSAGSSLGQNRALLPQEVALNFHMDRAEVVDSTAVIYGVFNTFGKLGTTTSEINVSFNVVLKGGQTVANRMDITEDFSKYDAVEHNWIILDTTIVIDPPQPGGDSGSGGFVPGVEQWAPEQHDIFI